MSARARSLSHSNCGSEPVSNVAGRVNCTAGLVVEALFKADEVCIDFLVVHFRLEYRMSHSAECLFELFEYVADFLLVLKVLLAQNPEIENLLSCPASYPESYMLSATIASI